MMPFARIRASRCRGVPVVVPSRDGRALLEAMLASLAPQIDQGEIIVVEMARRTARRIGWRPIIRRSA